MLKFWKRALILQLFTMERCQIFVLHSLHLFGVYDIELVVIHMIVQRRARILFSVHIQRIMALLVPLIFLGPIFNFNRSRQVASLSRPKVLIQSRFRVFRNASSTTICPRYGVFGLLIFRGRIVQLDPRLSLNGLDLSLTGPRSSPMMAQIARLLIQPFLQEVCLCHYDRVGKSDLSLAIHGPLIFLHQILIVLSRQSLF